MKLPSFWTHIFRKRICGSLLFEGRVTRGRLLYPEGRHLRLRQPQPVVLRQQGPQHHQPVAVPAGNEGQRGAEKRDQKSEVFEEEGEAFSGMESR